jgi:hypothetical protein
MPINPGCIRGPFTKSVTSVCIQKVLLHGSGFSRNCRTQVPKNETVNCREQAITLIMRTSLIWGGWRATPKGHPFIMSLGLENIAPGNPLRGTRHRGQQSVQAKAHPKNDPSTPQAWLPNRTELFSISHHSMTTISARFSTLRLPEGVEARIDFASGPLPVRFVDLPAHAK